MTIDKPPLGFWVQAISAKVLGFSGFSILLPEALATIGSVALVFHLVKRAFGGVAGLLAALMLAVVPISVAVGRNNTIDSLLVFTLLLAVWSGLKATERGSLSWLLVTGAIVGIGFEIKMMEAYLVLPALGLVYLLGAPISRRLRVLHLALAAVVMLGVSLAWPVAVDLTPASLRPWIDSTQNNSAISLALGYNGIDRLLGQNESVTQFLHGLGINLSASDSSTSTGGFGAGGMFNNGAAGPLRLFDQELAGQASWLLPLSLVGALLSIRLPITGNRRRQTALVFGGWLLAAGAFFSVANFFHSYYLVTLGPPVATLAAIGIVTAWRHARRSHAPVIQPAPSPRQRRGWLILPAALLATALVQAHTLSYYPTYSTWLTPIVLAGAAAGCTALLVARLRGSALMARAGTAVAIAALLVAPLVWSGYSTLYGSSAGIPSAGPQVAGTFGGFGGAPGSDGQFDHSRDDASMSANITSDDTTATSNRSIDTTSVDSSSSGSTSVDTTASGSTSVLGMSANGASGSDTSGGSTSAGASVADSGGAPGGGMPVGGGPGGDVSSELISYLEANQGSDTYLIATTDSQSAAQIILASDQPVMSLGGFTGSDPILTVDQFASLVESGQVRYVLAGGGMGGGPQGSGTSAIISWAKANGTLVTIGQSQVYDLGSLQGASA
ncbi:MAG: glycosyltransferase family 39 protein [Chloroflexi bacterium]|nr:glycosyltransferase family 39 protein [Chloroflexota bacterium]